MTDQTSGPQTAATLDKSDYDAMNFARTRVVSSGSYRLYWRDDPYGHKNAALFVGGLSIGSIMFCPTMPASGGGQRANEKPYRAWLMTDEDGKNLGWFLTEREAKDALVGAAIAELGK